MIPRSTTTTVRRTLQLAVAVATVVGFSACSSDDDEASDSADTEAPDDATGATDAPGDSGIGAGPIDAVIADFAFDPDPVEVVSGNTVTWTNNDGVAHTVTGTGDFAFDSGSLASGESFTLAVEAAGEFPYVCTIHGQMSGTLTST
jgi:plastocyanin